MDNTAKIIIVVLLVAAGAFGGYAFAKNAPQEEVGPATLHEQMDSMTAGLEGLQGTAFDYAFAREMIVHHEGAIDMAHMAKEKSQDPSVLALADAIIAAQETEIAMMEGWITMWEAQDEHVHEEAHVQ